MQDKLENAVAFKKPNSRRTKNDPLWLTEVYVLHLKIIKRKVA